MVKVRVQGRIKSNRVGPVYQCSGYILGNSSSPGTARVVQKVGGPQAIAVGPWKTASGPGAVGPGTRYVPRLLVPTRGPTVHHLPLSPSAIRQGALITRTSNLQYVLR